MQNALDQTLVRIPFFSVKLRSGLFWHYFVHSNKKMYIQEDVTNPCMHISEEKDGDFLIRVRYFDKRIALEVFHSVTDGSGAMVFLKTLIAQYLSLQGHNIPHIDGVLNPEEEPRIPESTISFNKFSDNSPVRRSKKVRAFHIKGTRTLLQDISIITGTIPIINLKKECKKYGVSITEYLVSAYLFILQKIQESEKPRHLLPIHIMVPINLRNFYKTQTLRNFSAFITPGIEPGLGTYSFEEILKLVHHFIRLEATEKLLRSQVAGNIKYAKNLLLRMMPLFIKNKLIFMGYKFFGPISFTSTISNLGVVKIPHEMSDHVETFDFMLGATYDTNISCAVLGYKNNLRIKFSRVIEESHIEREFFKFLVRNGIPVLIESNKDY